MNLVGQNQQKNVKALAAICYCLARHDNGGRVRYFFRILLVILSIAQVVTLAIAFQRPAYAYADPGSGLLFIQVASSMVAGALFIVRSKVRKLFRLGKNRTDESLVEQAPEIQQ